MQRYCIGWSEKRYLIFFIAVLVNCVATAGGIGPMHVLKSCTKQLSMDSSARFIF